jgi:hypothetical protein
LGEGIRWTIGLQVVKTTNSKLREEEEEEEEEEEGNKIQMRIGNSVKYKWLSSTRSQEEIHMYKKKKLHDAIYLAQYWIFDKLDKYTVYNFI